MNPTERYYKIDRLLHVNRAVSMDILKQKLEVSEATIHRDLEALRNRFSAPIIYDRQLRGYRFTKALPGGPRYELPGLWFNSAETHALLTFYHLLENLQPGLLTPHIQPLQAHIQALMRKGDHSFETIAQRIRILPLAMRLVKTSCFEALAHALLTRNRLTLTHYNRAKDIESQREVSPQRLAYHRDNWYLDAWCHKRNKLRTFAVDAIRSVKVSDKKARNIPDKILDAELGTGYGIFAGRKTRTAKLRFTPQRARWVATEQWHPNQKGTFEDGHYILEIPYSDDRELLMDILKHGADVEVLAPKALRTKVRESLRDALKKHQE